MKVVIELEFAERNIQRVDVYDYLKSLIEDESLDYTVYDDDPSTNWEDL